MIFRRAPPPEGAAAEEKDGCVELVAVSATRLSTSRAIVAASTAEEAAKQDENAAA